MGIDFLQNLAYNNSVLTDLPHFIVLDVYSPDGFTSGDVFIFGILMYAFSSDFFALQQDF